MDLTGKVKLFVKQHGLIAPGDHILLGVSGGPDSMALLHTLKNLRNQLGFKLSACHINHGLRKSALSDQRFVQNACQNLGIKCSVHKFNLNFSSLKGSLEEIAREKRLAALFQSARKESADTIALAHTQDDLAETVLMRIIRGTGLRGIPSILPKRILHKCCVIRPFLNTTRAEILDFLKKIRIQYKTDPTNKQKKFLRNRIRLELLPFLEKKYNADIKQALANLSLITTFDYAYLNSQAQKILHNIANTNRTKIKIPLAEIKKIHPSLQRIIFYLAIEKIKGDTRSISHAHILEIEKLLGKKSLSGNIHLPHKICVQKNTGSLIVTSKK